MESTRWSEWLRQHAINKRLLERLCSLIRASGTGELEAGGLLTDICDKPQQSCDQHPNSRDELKRTPSKALSSLHPCWSG